MAGSAQRVSRQLDARRPPRVEDPPAREHVSVRRMAPSDLPKVLSLLRRALGPDSRAHDPAYWSWKHEQNPFGLSPCLVAESGETIVGLRAFLRWEFRRDGGTLRAVRAVDTATDPDWQRRGIFSRLTLGLLADCEQEGIDLVFNTPNDKSRPGYLKMGWGIVGRAPLLVRPMRPGRIADALLRRKPTASIDSGPAQGFASVGDLLAGVDVHRLLGLDNGGSTDRSTIPEPGHPASPALTTSISPRYLAWRYRDVPGVAYRASWNDAHPGAALIFSLKERAGLQELSLAEVLVSSTQDIGQAAKLIRDVCRRTDADYAISVAGAGTAARSALMRAFFVPAPRGPVMCVRPLAEDQATTASDLFDTRNWRLSLGDVELF